MRVDGDDPAGTSEGSAGQVGVRVVADPFARVEFQDGEEPFEIWVSGADLAGLTTAETITNEPPLEVTDCTERDLVVSPRSYLLDLLETP